MSVRREAKKRDREMEEYVKELESRVNQFKSENSKLRNNLRAAAIGAKPVGMKRSVKKSSSQRTKRPTSARKKLPLEVSRTAPTPHNPNDEEKKYLANVLNTIQTRLGPTSRSANVPIQDNSAFIQGDLAQVKRMLRQKEADITLLTSKFEHLVASLKAEKEIQKQALGQRDEMRAQLQDALTRIRQLETEKQLADINQAQVPHLHNTIKRLEEEIRSRTSRNSAEWKSVMQQSHTEEHLKKVIAEYNAEIQQLKSELQEKQQESLEQAKRDRKWKAEREKTLVEFEALQAEKKNTDRILTKQSKEIRSMKEQLKILSDDSGIDRDDIYKALAMVRRQRENPSYVDFVTDARDEEPDTVPGLKKKVQKLEAKYKNAMADLQAKDDNLLLQQEVNRKLKSRAEAAVEQVERLKRQLAQSKHHHHIPGGLRDYDIMSDTSMFSNSEEGGYDLEAFTGLKNLLSAKVVRAELDPKFALFHDLAEPLTLITVECLDFGISTSERFGGYSPQYSLTSQYDIEVDDLMIQLLETDFIEVTLYLQSRNIGDRPRAIAEARIPLRTLLESRGHGSHVKVEGTAQLVNEELKKQEGGAEGERTPKLALAGVLHFELRMLRPIVSAAPSVIEEIPHSSVHKPAASPQLARVETDVQGTPPPPSETRSPVLGSRSSPFAPDEPEPRTDSAVKAPGGDEIDFEFQVQELKCTDTEMKLNRKDVGLRAVSDKFGLNDVLEFVHIEQPEPRFKLRLRTPSSIKDGDTIRLDVLTQTISDTMEVGSMWDTPIPKSEGSPEGFDTISSDVGSLTVKAYATLSLTMMSVKKSGDLVMRLPLYSAKHLRPEEKSSSSPTQIGDITFSCIWKAVGSHDEVTADIPQGPGVLKLQLVKARNLKEDEKNQDPYAKIEINGKKQKSKTHKKGGLHPEWNQDFEWTLSKGIDEAVMKLQVYDEDRLRDDFLGGAIVPVPELLRRVDAQGCVWIDLYEDWKKDPPKKRAAEGQVLFKCTFHADP